MIIGTVVGNIWATRKEEGLTGLKFLVIQPDLLDRDNPREPALVAVDRIGAGLGDKVMVTKGSPASYSDDNRLPIDALVIGIIDAIDTRKGEDGD
ncbi:ethanolamine utilization protein EutN [Bacillus canaveralius]|uniref:Ethanolamine utilization protein EutN n=1 Tax=Bacillus canaveralius TaxID=1403243 RepID=A0A2N5GI19_9BACI|nr:MULTISPECIES: EutN/CcmL family microcompartment protein [Bacillus]PLR80567.1 ethanolamine utilization protein EutN [Bacillus canaveralius]PLR87749.1 ethanolamine utilization protein EutN [Bacillus sp. V33-4]PLR92515.1 ethanolamine utilization protein EutN [Bacillus canaveralius]RSK55196.1 ethanolamine utilization protein EutN [Bacillus canaveralius]